VDPLPLDEVRASLSPSSAIVVYTSLPDSLLTFVIRSDRFRLIAQQVPRSQLEVLLGTFRRGVSGTGDPSRAAADAGAVLLGPIASDVAGASRVAFVADRHFAGVSFGALLDAPTGHFLIEQAAVTTAPSATLLVTASRRARRLAHPAVLAIGASRFDYERYPHAAPLDRVDGEVTRVGRLYRTSKVLTGDSATRDDVVSSLGAFDLIHFAGHGIAEERVSRSALLLAPDRNDSGELRVSDIAALRLRRPQAVILAACDAAAPVVRGDGAENLALAFLAAGVPTVVAALSDVDDALAPRLMTAIHQRIAAGDDPIGAVSNVLRGEIRNADGSARAPRDWSNFVVVGGSPDFVVPSRKGGSS
jgi:CHAT domain-containing protein